MCYSPPGEEHVINNKSNYLQVLMKHVFAANTAVPSLEDIINAREQEDEILDNM